MNQSPWPTEESRNRILKATYMCIKGIERLFDLSC